MTLKRTGSGSNGFVLSAVVLMLLLGWSAAPAIGALPETDLVCPLCDEPAPAAVSASGLVGLILWTMFQKGVSFVLMGAVAMVGLPWLIAGGAIAILSIPGLLKLR